MDLNAPLGMMPPRKPRRTFGGWNQGLIAAVAGTLAAIIGGVALFILADPRGGEPYAVASIPPPDHVAAGGDARTRDGVAGPDVAAVPGGHAARDALDPLSTGSVPRAEGGRAVATTDTIENGVKVFRSNGTAPASAPASERGPLIIDVSKVLDDPSGRSRALARSDALGKADTSAKASMPGAADVPPPAGRRPRVAIFVSGMGLSAEATKTALETMPPAVTFAFVPYGATIGATVAAAKAKGHEILLQIPMRNATGGAPGPHALHADEPAAALRDDLAWLTSRFTGYDGVTNLLGAPVTADETIMTGLLREVGGRGLFYLDDGLSRRETGVGLAAGLDVPARRADIVLDATADPRVIEANLRTLATIARRNGSAIGMASGLPDHMAAIARFAGGLEADGIALVPVAAIVAGDATKRRGVAVNR